MPRLSPLLLRRAALESRHLPPLLRECRDMPSARNELRWLKEHVDHPRGLQRRDSKALSLAALVRRRSKGEPLQYIIGNQPFGDLEILCRSGVLIPRPETEVYTQKVAHLLTKLRQIEGVEEQDVRILDLCTGSGCIALLLHNALNSVQPFNDQPNRRALITGADISDHALILACQNLEHNIKLGLLGSEAKEDVSFWKADVLQSSEELLRSLDGESSTGGLYDVVISNPPYISPSDYAPGGNTTRSVRKHEPRLALVPPRLFNLRAEQADVNGI